LLIGSIPLPDPDRPWTGETAPSEIGRQAKDGAGCLFAPRCPHAFEQCLEIAPPLYLTDSHRSAACYLYPEHAPLRAEEMDSVFIHA